MKRILLYLAVIVAAFFVILYIRNPELLEEIWMWVVGLFAVVSAYLGQLADSLKSRLWSKTGSVPGADKHFLDLRDKKSVPDHYSQSSAVTKEESPEIEEMDEDYDHQLKFELTKKEKEIHALQMELQALKNKGKLKDTFSGESLYLMRYLDDGETTLGLLFIDNSFFCYTLEGSGKYQDRISEGDYPLSFDPVLNDITKKYQRKGYTSNWFKWHIIVKNVPGNNKVYLYAGGEEGKHIMISKGIKSKETKKVLTDARETFETFYHLVKEYLEMNVPVRIRIFNEKWIQQINN